ncbi:MAG: hypothetical protein ACRDQ5_15390, partial [Sciscionella sp.]
RSERRWWGAILSHPRRIVVVESNVPEHAVASVIRSLAKQHDWPGVSRSYMYKMAGLVFLLVVVVILAVLLNSAYENLFSLPYFLLFGFVVAFIVPALNNTWRRSRTTPHSLPAYVQIRDVSDQLLWNLVCHLDAYGHYDAETTTAARGLLWVIACTNDGSDHRAVLDKLADTFHGDAKRNISELRAATASVWALLSAAE